MTMMLLLANDDDTNVESNNDNDDECNSVVENAIRRAVTVSILCLCGGEKSDKMASKESAQRPENNNKKRNEEETGDAWQEILIQTAKKTISRTTSSSSSSSSSSKKMMKNSSSNSSSSIDGKPWDYEVRTAPALFHRFKNRHRRRPPLSTNDDDDDDSVDASADAAAVEQPTWQITSDMGLVRTIHSPVELAILLGLLVEQELLNHYHHLPAGFDVRAAAPSGFLLIVSPRRQDDLRQAGRLPCPLCPTWCKGEKGLWWHQQEQHETDHAIATAFAANITLRVMDALVVYNPNYHHHNNNNNTTTTNKNNIQRQFVLQKQQQQQSKSRQEGPIDCGSDVYCDTDIEEKKSNKKDSIIIITQSSNRNPFQQAAHGDLEGLKQSIAMAAANKKNPTNDDDDVVTAVDHYGSCVLLWAAGGGHLHIVQYLVQECNCHPVQMVQRGRRAFQGRTALHWAARKGHVDVVEYLLQWQQEQQQKQKQQQQQQHTNKNDDNFNLLEATTLEGTTSFCWAAYGGPHQTVLEVLYRAGCNVQATNDYGCNAILWCAQGGGGQDDNNSATSSRLCYTMEWLQSVGCRINQVNANGHSLVHKAAQRGRRDIICEWFFDKMLQQLLLLSTSCSALASCNTKTDSAVATSSCAENGQQILSLNQLLQLVGPDSGGCTPSDLACMEGHGELAEWIATEMEARLVTAAATIAVSTRAAGRPGEGIIPNDETLPPSWLAHGPLPPVISCPNNMMDNSCQWGPWTGVRRMRSIWNQTLSAA